MDMAASMGKTGQMIWPEYIIHWLTQGKSRRKRSDNRNKNKLHVFHSCFPERNQNGHLRPEAVREKHLPDPGFGFHFSSICFARALQFSVPLPHLKV